MVDDAKLAAVLADPDWTRRVVAAAARSVNALETAQGDLTPDGDHVLLPIRTGLTQAFVNEAELR